MEEKTSVEEVRVAKKKRISHTRALIFQILTAILPGVIAF